MPIKILNQETELVPVKSLKLHPLNPNEGDEEELAQSIDTIGFYGSLIVQRSTCYILAGNHRYKKVVAAGGHEIPVTWLDVDDDTAYDIMINDNEICRRARHNPKKLATILQTIADARTASDGRIGRTPFVRANLDSMLAKIRTDVEKAAQAREKKAKEAAAKEEAKLNGPQGGKLDQNKKENVSSTQTKVTILFSEDDYESLARAVEQNGIADIPSLIIQILEENGFISEETRNL